VSIVGFVLLLAWLVAVCLISLTIWRRRATLVSKRGTGVRADVERLREVPRARLSDVSIVGRDVTRLVLVATRSEDRAEGVDGDFSVALNASDPEYETLREWLDRGSDLGVVLPPGGRLIRLRNLEDLQPLTLRRVDSPA
jgi:hypothetical protein